LHHAITAKNYKYSTKYDTGVIRVVIFSNSSTCKGLHGRKKSDK